jgi:hypothetical protein
MSDELFICIPTQPDPVDVLRAENERLCAEIIELREYLSLRSEVLAEHQGSPQREWHSVGAWLYPGDTINVVCAPMPKIEATPLPPILIDTLDEWGWPVRAKKDQEDGR